MIKPNSCIYLIPLHSQFNKDEAPVFNSFDKKHSIHLYTALTLNFQEIAKTLSPSISAVFCFDEKDRGYLPEEINISGTKYFFGKTLAKPALLKLMADRYFNQYNNNLIIFTDTIGISTSDILKAIDLLSRDEETVIIGNSFSNRVTFIGFNNYNHEMMQDIELTELLFESVLNKVCKFDYYLHVLNGSFSINTLQDFRNLYAELSKKESWSYCSQNMHEKFTHLFIEYKELLK